MKLVFNKIGTFIVAGLLMIMLAIAAGCGGGQDSPSPGPSVKKLQIISVKGTQNIATSSFKTSAISINSCGNGHIASGPPEYINVTLKKIDLTYDAPTSNVVTIWSDNAGYTLHIAGNGAVDLSGMGAIGNIPAGHISQVTLEIDPIAQIKGSLTNAMFFWDGPYFPGGSNVLPYLCTKSGRWFDTINKVNTGATTYATFTTGDPEETNVTISGQITTSIDATVVDGDSPLLTILIDTSRILRFWDGYGDLTNNPNLEAYFFSDGVFQQSIAAFVGDYGSIQGYQTDYLGYDENGQGPAAVKGWMTVIFKPNGDLLSGMLIGDDDNDLCIAKGIITAFPVGQGDLKYDLGNDTFTVTGFQKITNPDDSTAPLTFDSTQTYGGTQTRKGTAVFTLRYSSQ